MKEQRNLKVSCCKAGGNASKNALSYKLTLPVAWIKEMGISPEDREITATFENNKIIIEKGKRNESL
jgi:hypothetical protein|nr:MAG TPA: Toxin SymE, type I toxin-antitoxin system [Caudoviricetes sp.]